MEYPTYRLFDSLQYQREHFNKPDMMNAKIDGTWVSFSTEKVIDTVNKFSAGLLQLGIGGYNFTAESSDKIAIISQNRPEWLFTDLAVQQIGAILVPIYPTTNPHELEFILNESEAKYIFVSNAELLEKVQQLNTPFLKGIYTFDEISGAEHYNKVLALANAESLTQVEDVKKQIPNTHTETIIYTSGTTGTPKGVMLSHENIVSNVFFAKASFPFPDQPETKVLSFLPLNHIFEKMVSYIYLFSGISIFYAESLDTIGDNLKEVKPNGFTTVPRLLEKVYEKIMSKGEELRGIKRALFFWAVGLGRKYDNIKDGGFFYNTQLKLARKIIFSKWKEALGGNIEFIITGGAAASEKLLRIFNAAGIPVYEGYGPTEHSPVISVNRKEAGGTYYGTVGPPIKGVTVKLAEDNEILVQSPSMMQGYYKRQDLTDEVIIGGWLHTGDIGTWVEDKYLKITDRKKELFKTSGGKYVAPQPIENKMKESRYIEQIIVVGNDKKFVSALIVPSFTTLKDWLKENHKNDMSHLSNKELIALPEIDQLIESVITHYNKNFNQVEQVKKFVLLPDEWSVDTGEMTPKLSLRRKVILEKFKADVDRIYD
ncbi:MAG: AMP-dependent synthetase/ligase [Niabella sp.]